MNPQIQEKDGKRYVKVRIAVVVDHNGGWVAVGDSEQDTNAMVDDAAEAAFMDELRAPWHIRFVHALIPVPDAEIGDLIGEAETI